MDICAKYEEHEFQKLQEVDYFYLKRKKHYLALAFASEFSVKIENNKYANSRSSFGISTSVSHASTMNSS